MNKLEFEQKFGGDVSFEEYAVIERIYTFHPAIPNVDGHATIAALYAMGGMRLMHDMMPAANAAAEIDSAVIHANTVLSRLHSLSRALAHGNISPEEAVQISRNLVGSLSASEEKAPETVGEVAA